MRSLLFVLFLFSSNCYSQLKIDEQFDSDLAIWQGDVDYFKIENSALRLNGPDQKSNLWISSEFSDFQNLEFSLELKLDFSPSSSNGLEIYLISGSQSIDENNEYIRIRIGQTNEDFFNIYQATNFIAKSNTNFINNKWHKLKIELKNNLLKLFIDGTFDSEMNIDFKLNKSNFVALNPIYSSSSRKDLYYFDNIYLGPKKIDQIKPKIEYTYCNFIDSMYIDFSESIDTTTITEKTITINDRSSTNFSFVNNGKKILFNPQDYQTDHIIVKISGLKDLAQNPNSINDTVIEFRKNYRYDIVINEIHHKPTPIIGLPDHKYIELYNNSLFEINLKNWKLKFGTKEILFADLVIKPKSYLTLQDPIFTILKDLEAKAETIYLLSNSNELIDFVYFSDLVHNKEYKEKGGWSIERVNYSNFSNQNNWQSSISTSGGSPDSINSVFNLNFSDTIQPEIMTYELITDNSIRISFNESILNLNKSNISSNTEISQINTNIEQTNTTVYFKNSIQESKKYYINFNNSIYDYAYNTLKEPKIEFGKTSSCNKSDVLFSEIMFNPNPGGERFIELYNNSSHYFNLNQFYLKTQESDYIQLNYYLFAPQKLVILAKNQQFADNNSPSIENLVESKLPNLDDHQGELLLYFAESSNREKVLIDSLYYSDSYHSKLIEENEGVSLERISYDKKTEDKFNWGSNLISPYYNSAGKTNSLQSSEIETKSDIQLNNKIFEPRKKEKLEILFSELYSGSIVTIKIFNTKSQLIKTLVKNEPIYNGKSIYWEGEDGNRTILNSGIYIIHFDFLFSDKSKREFNKIIVLKSSK